MRPVLLSIALLIAPMRSDAFLPGQFPNPAVGDSLPSSCTVGWLFFKTPTTPGLYGCTSTNTWTILAAPNPPPSGAIMFVDTGSCPTGFAEVSASDAHMIEMTLNAHGDVGTTGGNDNITPTGSVTAPTFTGSSANTSAVSAGTPTGTNSTVSFTPAGTNGASATSGNCAATNIAAGTGSTTACKATAPNLTVTAQTFTGSSGTVPAETFTGNAMGTHQHTLTATGTNSVPTFTGTQFDNRPAFVKWIACKKS